MQSLAPLVLALLAVPAASSSVSAHGALSAARVWLRSHSGSPDELAALKGTNPEAYALVKALLTKRSLGLLDSKHPSASLSKAGKSQEETVQQSPEVFEQFATPGELQHAQMSLGASHTSYSKVEVPYAEVQSAPQQDFLNWKPQTAMDDDAMVQNVLGAVAELKGKKAGFMSTRSSVEARSSKNSFTVADIVRHSGSFTAAVERELPRPRAKVVKSTVVKSTVPTKKKSSWMDFSMMTDDQISPDYKPLQGLQAAPVAAAAPVKENSYHKRLVKPEPSQAVPEWKMLTVEPVEAIPPKKLKLLKVASSVATGPNYLNSFSWDKDDDAQPTKPVLKHIAPEALKKSKKKAQLLTWLGVVEKAPAPKVSWAKVVQGPAKPPVKPPKSSNHYMLDLAD